MLYKNPPQGPTPCAINQSAKTTDLHEFGTFLAHGAPGLVGHPALTLNQSVCDIFYNQHLKTTHCKQSVWSGLLMTNGISTRIIIYSFIYFLHFAHCGPKLHPVIKVTVIHLSKCKEFWIACRKTQQNKKGMMQKSSKKNLCVRPLANVVNPLINSTGIWKSDAICQISHLFEVTFGIFC